MKKISEKFRHYARLLLRLIKTPKGAVITFLVLLGAWLLFSTANKDLLSGYDIGEVTRRDITKIVDVTGKIKPVERVDMALERSGKISRINATVGQNIPKGTVILSAAGADLYADLAEAQSNLVIEQLELEKISKTSLIDFNSAEEDLLDEMESAYAKADDAVRNTADQFFHGPEDGKSFGAIVTSGGTEVTLGATIDQMIDLRYQRKSILKELAAWRTYLDNPTSTEIKDVASSAELCLVNIQTFLNDIALIVNSYYESSVSNTIVDGYRSDISSARTSINTALTNLRSTTQDYLTTEANSLSSTENRLQEVLLQEQRVKSAEARVSAVYAEIEKSTIRAPFDGVITRIETEVGEMVSLNTPIVSIMSSAKFEIETFIPEADIADVALNNRASVTLDAYGSDITFEASVGFIDPAETVLDGVPTYKALLQFKEEDKRLLPGMTANVDITTGTATNVLTVPYRAVIEKDGRTIVKVVGADEKITEQEVDAGLRGSDGFVEITNGLNEGDRIVVFSRD